MHEISVMIFLSDRSCRHYDSGKLTQRPAKSGHDDPGVSADSTVSKSAKGT